MLKTQQHITPPPSTRSSLMPTDAQLLGTIILTPEVKTSGFAQNKGWFAPHPMAGCREATHQLLQLSQVPLSDDLLAVSVLLRLMDAAEQEDEEGGEQGAAEQAHLSTAEQRLGAALTPFSHPPPPL